VGCPLLSITAATCLGILSTRDWITLLSICDHSSCNICQCSSLFFGKTHTAAPKIPLLIRKSFPEIDMRNFPTLRGRFGGYTYWVMWRSWLNSRLILAHSSLSLILVWFFVVFSFIQLPWTKHISTVVNLLPLILFEFGQSTPT